MQKIDVEKFQKKIHEYCAFSMDDSLEMAEGILEILPEEIQQNVVEWYEGKDLSDIRIAGFSVPMILAYWQNDNFLAALACMIDLKRNPDGGKELIWCMKR